MAAPTGNSSANATAGTPASPYTFTPSPADTGRPAPGTGSGEHETIGAPGEPIRVLAFSGGLFDAAMQLGTVHALLVAAAKAPDVIAGISTGAINAVAAAEILQAGDDLTDPQLRLDARISRFRQIFEAYRQSPEDVLAPLLPDIYQIDAEAALKPTNLPIYTAEERSNRHRAAQSRAGLIKLTNDILRLDVSIGSIARGVRACLGLIAARELRTRRQRLGASIVEATRLWRVLASNIFALAPVGARLASIAISPTARRVADWMRTSDTLRLALDWFPRLDATRTLSALAKRVEGPPRASVSDEPVGEDAGRLIFRGWLRQHVLRAIRWCFGFAVVATLIVGIPAIALLILVAGLVQLALPLMGAVAHSSTWLTFLGVVQGARTTLITSAPSWIRGGGAFFGAMFSYLGGVVLPVLGATGHGLVVAHHWLDLHWRIDAPFHYLDPRTVFIPGWALVLAAIIFIGLGARKFVSRDAILRYYGILDAVLDPYSLQSWLIRLFDPSYYGSSGMDEIVERALAPSRAPEHVAASPKTLAQYSTRPTRIHVDPMAADVATGKLTVLPGDTPVVDALLAATALPPFYQAQPIPATKAHPGIRQSWFIAGTVVANEPTRAIVSHLTPLVNEASTEVQIYSASSLPLSASELGPEDDKTEYSGLVDSSRRALTLQSFRDATLDRRMTDLVARALPSGRAAWRAPDAPDTRFVRASVHPIELDKASSLNSRLLGARSALERRRMIGEAVADGCRSSIEVLLHQSLANESGEFVPCRKIVQERVGADRLLPCASDRGPGLTEVCQFCAVRDRKPGSPGVGAVHRQSLRVPQRRRNLPLWPTDGDRASPAALAPATRASGRASTETQVTTTDRDERRAGRLADRMWPIDRNGLAGGSRPTVSLLFSGGVFRGVYLAGVINALNEAGATPDLIAGSSIGSITAAMAARVFSEPADARAARASRIARLAATYLAVDRLVLTDRFGEFVRNFTLRASATGFSIRDIDTTFRAFDRHGAASFNDDTRRVLAGLERLLYVSPFEAFDLARSSRMRHYERVLTLLADYAQEWLERGAVGLEVLGSEPLELLIRNHVLDGAAVNDVGAEEAFTTRLDRSGLQFIATVTNLTRGRLETMHVPATSKAPDRRARLVEALLASSAFPAVFRPRWSWEVMPETSAVEQYIDGGVMDNLPLDAVARFLNDAREMHRLTPRPMVRGAAVPHLVFAGSLEVERPRLVSEDATRYVAGRWIQAYARARELSYNNKIEGYAATQRGLRHIWQSDATMEQERFEPLDLEVVAVKPQWLCRTFAFHPMLGYRRVDQARSIAHGCRTTLERLYALKSAHSEWTDGWGLTLPGAWSDRPEPEAGARGTCWYRRGCECPFSAQALARLDPPLRGAVAREVGHIHELCGRRETHQVRGFNPLLGAEQNEPA